MNKVEIILLNYGTLEIVNNIEVPLNYNLNDIRDISTRGGAWSKTIQLYGTNQNNNILGAIYDVNADFLTFNPKKKEDVKIVINGQVVFEGIFQLMKVHKKYTGANWHLLYDCYIKSDTSNFFTAIDGKYLRDINLSEYNHLITESLVYNNMMTGSYLDGYQYFLGYINPVTDISGNISHNYNVDEMRPAIYAKVYFDKIFSGAGYTYDFPELFDINFDKLIIPFNESKISPYNINATGFRAGVSTRFTDTLLTSGTTYPAPFLTPSPQTIIFGDTANDVENWVDYTFLYNNATSAFTVSGSDTVMEFNIKYEANINFKAISVLSPFVNLSTIYPVQLIIKQQLAAYDSSNNYIGAVIDVIVTTINIPDSLSGAFWVPGTTTLLETINVDLNAIYNPSLWPNAAYLKPLTTAEMTSDPFWEGFRGVAEIEIDVLPQNDETGHFTNTPDSDVSEGSPLFINNVIPNKIKQAEFISAIVKMYNLYIREDANDSKKLLIKTRDTFYANGTELNWSDKIDVTTIELTLLSNTQNKIKKFSYQKDDKDAVLVEYDKTVNETYGQLDYVFDNDFIKGESNVSPIFAPTVQVRNYKKNLPYIPAKSPKNKIRILSVGDIQLGDWSYTYNDISVYPATQVVSPKTNFRHVGHFYPNSFTPTEDINFGLCDFYAHTYSTITNNNLFNRFYRTQYDIFENGYMLTADFKLSYSDVADLDLSEKIWVNGAWWNINKIIDYNPASDQLTKVELISAESQLGVFQPNNNVYTSAFVNNNIVSVINSRGKQDGTGNVFGKDIGDFEVVGSKNTFQSDSANVITSGDGNYINGKTLLNTGNYNNISGTNIAVLSLDGQTFNESNRVYANTLIRVSNFISAGRDQVLNAFPDNKVVNIISGGRDEVRPLGSHTIESKIDAGRNKV